MKKFYNLAARFFREKIQPFIIISFFPEFYTSLLVTLSLAMIGWVFGLVAVIILIVYACLPNKVTGILSIIFCLISGKIVR